MKKIFEGRAVPAALNERMVSPVHNYNSNTNVRTGSQNECILEFIRTSSIGFISICGNDLEVVLPESMHSKCFGWKVVDYPKLMALDGKVNYLISLFSKI
jgi:hypothetical protein